MSKVTRVIPALLAMGVAAIGVSSCSGGDGLPGDAVADVGGTTITRAELSHWMSTLAGGDFYEIGRGHAVPAGLVSEPPRYAACVARLQAAAESAHSGRSTPTDAAPQETPAGLLSKCHQLYVALRLQAIAYLVQSDWIIKVAAELGVWASAAEVRATLEKVKATEYPRLGQFQRYLANSRRSLADELLVVKLDVLSKGLQQKVSSKGKKATIEFAEAGQRVTAKTNCRPGYVVPHCRQFRKWRESTRAPVVLLEQVSTITGIPCVNRQACG